MDHGGHPRPVGQDRRRTGANGGLGLEVARELARQSAQVVMASRDQTKAEDARTSIRAEIPGASLESVPLDLASLASVPIQRPPFGRSRSRKALTTLWEVSEHETGFAFDVPRAGVT